MASGFKEGNIEYTTSRLTAEDLTSISLEGWRAGYVAFSAWEEPFNLQKHANLSKMAVERTPDGFLVEIGLWRNKGSVFEEICLERDDHGFVLQGWRLETAPDNGKTSNCWWRHADTVTRKSKFFKKSVPLKSIEVVFWEHRLNFFITVGGC